jgi:hypothetical protein
MDPGSGSEFFSFFNTTNGIHFSSRKAIHASKLLPGVMSSRAAEEVRRKNHVILGHVRREIDERVPLQFLFFSWNLRSLLPPDGSWIRFGVFQPFITRAEHLRMMSRTLPGDCPYHFPLM